MTEPKLRERAGILPLFRLIWHHGGPRERFFLLMFLITYVLVPLIFALGILASWPFEVLFSYVLAAVTSAAYIGAMLEALYSLRVLQEGHRRGWWGRDEAYHMELMRFLESCGEGGLAPGVARWAILAWGAYYLLMAGAIYFAFALLPVLGPWTPYAFSAIALPVVIGLSIADRWRVRNAFREANRRGFYLYELRLAKRKARHPENPPVSKD